MLTFTPLSGAAKSERTNPLASLQVDDTAFDWQLSAMAQYLVKIGQAKLRASQWREFLHSFTFVKDVSLVGEDSVRLVAPALQELAGERVEEVLPALQNLFFSRLRGKAWMPSQAVEEAIEDFTITRRLHGHPLSLHNWGTKYMPRTYAQ